MLKVEYRLCNDEYYVQLLLILMNIMMNIM